MRTFMPSIMAFPLFRLLGPLAQHRHAIFTLIKADLADRYLGNVLGPLWAIGYPLFLLVLYSILFGYVFPHQLFGEGTSHNAYTIYILSGLVPWLAIAETLGKSPSMITSQAHLIKQAPFPTEVLIIKEIGLIVFNQFILTVLLVLLAAFTRGLPTTAFMVVPLMIIQAIAMTGLACIIAAISVFFRDVHDIMQMIVTAGLFLAPILYAPERLEKLSPKLIIALNANPVTHLVNCYRDTLFTGKFEHPWSWVVLTVLSFVLFYCGHWVMAKFRPVLGDML